MKRVAVTGLGVVSSLGNDVENFWKNIRDGKSGVKEITSFDTTDYKCKFAAVIDDFDISEYADKKEIRKMDRFTQFAVKAAIDAYRDSGLDIEKEDPWRIGVINGSGIGGIETFAQQQTLLNERGPSRVSPFFIPMMIANMAPAQIAIMLGIRGINENIVTACASGTNAIGTAMREIQYGSCDVIIAGGAEAAVTPIAVAGFCNMKALSTRNDDPKGASRPFDKDRDGFVMGEGAGYVVLEEMEHAKARGANIICELAGYGATDDAYHITSPMPDGEGGAKAMELAIKDAGVTPGDIDYINAHGTSTPLNDKTETAAVKRVYGDAAYKINISSTKSMTGHLLGAAGAVEAIASVKALSEGIVPPTIGYMEKDPECDLNYTPNEAKKTEIDLAMFVSLGFGGHNACIGFKRI